MAEKVKLRKKDEELENIIMERLLLDEDNRMRIRSMLQYNMLTTKQVSFLTGLSVFHITNKTRPKFTETGEAVAELDIAYPFPDYIASGPKFIVRNEKLEALLRNGRQRKL